MDDKLKKVFDALQPNEVDVLLKNINTDGIDKSNSLSEKRIKKNVFKRAGISRLSRYRKVALVASAAVFFISVGIMSAIDAGKTGKQQLYGYVSEEEKNGTGSTAKGDMQVISQVNSDAVSTKKISGKGKNIRHPEKLSSVEVEQQMEEKDEEIEMRGFVAKFGSLSEMEEDCDYIVYGTKTKSSLVRSDEDNIYKLEAGFRIEEVLSDNLGTEDISSNITVNEGIRYNSERDVFIRVGGYSYMKTGNEYVLFVKKTSGEEYRIDGLLYGKIPVNESEADKIVDEMFTSRENIKTLKDIIKEAWDEYVDGNFVQGESEEENIPDDNTENINNNIQNENEPAPDYYEEKTINKQEQ